MQNKYIFAADTTITDNMPELVKLLDYITNNDLTEKDQLVLNANLRNAFEQVKFMQRSK